MAALEGSLLRFKMFSSRARRCVATFQMFSRFSCFPLVSITVFLRVLVFLPMLYVFNENHFFLAEKKGMLDGAFGKFEILDLHAMAILRGGVEYVECSLI